MPLFGSFFTDKQARGALRDSLIPLEMPPVPGHRLHATGGRKVILAMRDDPNAVHQTALVFDTFAQLCDRYADSHKIPFLSRTDGKGGTKAANLESAARQFAIWSHYRYGSTIGIDAALFEGLSRHPELLVRAGEPGSPRWDATILVATAGAERIINAGAKSFQSLYRLQIGAMKMYTKDLDSPLLSWLERPGKSLILSPLTGRATANVDVRFRSCRSVSRNTCPSRTGRDGAQDPGST